jgi:uncharacterized membrane protein YfcA
MNSRSNQMHPAIVAAAAAATAGALLFFATARAPQPPLGTSPLLRSPPYAAAATAAALLPLTLPAAATLALVFAICVLAAGSGIGGGAALVPVFLTAGGFGGAPSHAVALSNLTILGAALSAFTLNVRRRRPGPAGLPLIDWDVVLLMEPATIVGAVGGAFINRILPPWLTLCGLAVVLTAVTHNVCGRARAQWAAEADARDSLRARLLAVEDGEGGSGGDGRGGASAAPPGEDGAGRAPPAPSLARPPAVPAGKVAALLSLFTVVAASDFFKARVACGSLAYWVAVLAVVPPAVAVTAFARRAALRGAYTQDDADADLAWTPARTLAFPAVSALAGLCAGLFGVGGGILKAPLLLALGVDPSVAAATSMTMILFTSAAASTVYLGWGTPRDWSTAVFLTGLAASAAGVLGLARAVDAAGGRRSLVTIAMAATLGVSLLASGWEAGAVTVAAARAGELGKHGSVCVRV